MPYQHSSSLSGCKKKESKQSDSLAKLKDRDQSLGNLWHTVPEWREVNKKRASGEPPLSVWLSTDLNMY